MTTHRIRQRLNPVRPQFGQDRRQVVGNIAFDRNCSGTRCRLRQSNSEQGEESDGVDGFLGGSLSLGRRNGKPVTRFVALEHPLPCPLLRENTFAGLFRFSSLRRNRNVANLRDCPGECVWQTARRLQIAGGLSWFELAPKLRWAGSRFETLAVRSESRSDFVREKDDFLFERHRQTSQFGCPSQKCTKSRFERRPRRANPQHWDRWGSAIREWGHDRFEPGRTSEWPNDPCTFRPLRPRVPESLRKCSQRRLTNLGQETLLFDEPVL